MSGASSEMQVMRIAAAQHGVVTTAQLAAAGIGRGAVAHRVSHGLLRRIHRGVHLVGPVEPPHARAMAAVLAVGPRAVLSHRTAAALWGLLAPAPGPVHVTTAGRGGRSRAGIHVHTTAILPQGDVGRHRQLPLTSPERPVLDLAATLPEQELNRAVEEAQVLRLLSARGLRAALDRHPGRPGVARLRAALDRGETPALTRSEAERRLLALVRASGLPQPRTNVRVHRFEVDALWEAQRLIVEVDGYAFHSSRAAFERDRVRDADLQARGYAVIRVTWRQLRSAPEPLIARLAGALAVRGA